MVFADNRIFNVNGSGLENLVAALDLVFNMTGNLPIAWKHDKDYGMILYWTKCDTEDIIPFPSALSAAEIAPIILKYLSSDMGKEVKLLSKWDINCNHDGDNTLGWRVYCDDWGHVNNQWKAFIAITPAYIWHGK